VLFEKDRLTWNALDTPEAGAGVDQSSLTWTVAFDGRQLGVVSTKDGGFESPYSWTYPRDKLLELSDDTAIPEVINRTGFFGGWCEEPRFRPLVVVTSPNYRDPAGWKPADTSPALLDELFPQFRTVAGDATRCQSEDAEPSAFEYQQEDLVTVRTYRDRLGRALVALSLDPGKNKCDGPWESPWSSHWFLVGGESSQYLGSQLSLVDAGDYDGDGSSEVVFWHSGYDEDGYALFYDDFRKHVRYYWTYH